MVLVFRCTRSPDFTCIVDPTRNQVSRVREMFVFIRKKRPGHHIVVTSGSSLGRLGYRLWTYEYLPRIQDEDWFDVIAI